MSNQYQLIIIFISLSLCLILSSALDQFKSNACNLWSSAQNISADSTILDVICNIDIQQLALKDPAQLSQLQTACKSKDAILPISIVVQQDICKEKQLVCTTQNYTVKPKKYRSYSFCTYWGWGIYENNRKSCYEYEKLYSQPQSQWSKLFGTSIDPNGQNCNFYDKTDSTCPYYISDNKWNIKSKIQLSDTTFLVPYSAGTGETSVYEFQSNSLEKNQELQDQLIQELIKNGLNIVDQVEYWTHGNFGCSPSNCDRTQFIYITNHMQNLCSQYCTSDDDCSGLVGSQCVVNLEVIDYGETNLVTQCIYSSQITFWLEAFVFLMLMILF